MDDREGAPDDGAADDFDALFDGDDPAIDRAVLNETEEGRRIQAAYVAAFGEFVRAELRPSLRDVARNGGQPQLLVNGLADLMRSVADQIEFPLDHPRSGFPPDLDHTAT
jgi:hypothetical protein